MTHSQEDQNLSEGTVRIGSVLSIPDILKIFTVDPAEVLAEAGLSLKLFDDADNVITYSSRSRLIKACMDKTGCNHIGLFIGKQSNLSSFGLLGYLVRHSPTVELALRSFINHFHLNATGASVNLIEQGDLACLSYNIYQPHAVASEQIEDGAVAIVLNILRDLCGRNLRPVEASFTHRKPKDIEAFRQFFKIPLHFDAEVNGVWFPARWLKQSVQGNDPELHRLLQKQIDVLEVSYQSNFPEQVRQVLHTALLTGHAKAEQVAALFSMHSRTFNRRLKAYDTSFKKLADQARYEIAQQLLETSELEIIQIAETLDYADASAFTRAFRRWSGITPSTWRAGHDEYPQEN